MHLWEFGDMGSILVINDEEPMDHILFSTHERARWQEYKYKFTDKKIRVRFTVMVPLDTSQRLILLG
ncbi:hypothetical protein L208DRAFT_1416878 [Tricholoma matsutake]|nr:hypothetical protein L208DRAFT_1416878 [Tricholoma matsutake 945]